MMETLNAASHNNAHLTACPDCDLLIQLEPLGHRQQARCPRCKALLDTPANSAAATAGDQGLAAALAGLILFVPAASQPIMQFELIGQQGSNTLFDGVVALWQAGFPALSLLVLLCSLLAPLAHLGLNAVVALCLRVNRVPRRFPQLLKALQFFQHWGMLEVYAISILVAYVKMLSDGEVHLLSGSYCIAGLLLTLILTSRQFHSEAAWQAWDRQGEHGNAPAGSAQ